MLILFGERRSSSHYLSCIWRSTSGEAGEFVSVAYPQWELVFSRIAGKFEATLRGPETAPSRALVAANGSWLGLRFKCGVMMPSIHIKRYIDSAVTLPTVGDDSFWLARQKWEAPTFDNADDFISRLVRAGLLIRDPVVCDSLKGEYTGRHTMRTRQRRFIKATGLTRQAILANERAHAALTMLKSGLSVTDTIAELGFSDQPHLTRSLKRFVGLTPGQLVSGSDHMQLSFVPSPSPGISGVYSTRIDCRFRSRRDL